MGSSRMRHIIVGTAGHIDHGKTALVRALTGIETDRLEEEKRRGISIDLGFAHLEMGDDFLFGFVDVPGHERFVKNMLAGAGGIDLVLLVIAADESIKPQTREHFEICRLLGISRGVIALTKADLVDAEILGLARLEVEEFVAGSFLDTAEIIPVSAKTGQGMDELRGALRREAEKTKTKDSSRHLRLPVDRSFSMRGHGAVVTGTVISGIVMLEQELEVHPTGRRVRVRGIQVHGRGVSQAMAGQRTALNLSGAQAGDLHRGMMLGEPGVFRATRRLDCAFELLPAARPLKHRAPVHFHAWTSETEAEMRLLESVDALESGSRGYVRLKLREPVLLLPGDRFIVRMFSPVVTIGGGSVVDIDPPERLRRQAARIRAERLAGGGLSERIKVLVAESPCGMSVQELIARSGARADEVQAAVDSQAVLALNEPQPWLVSRNWIETASSRLREAVAAFHRQNPLLPGVAKEDLRSRELGGVSSFLMDALLRQTPELAAEGDLVRLASHKLHLKEEEAAALGRIESAFEQAGLTVPGVSEVLARCGVEPARARTLLQMLLREKRLVKVSDDLVFHPVALTSVKGLLARHKGERFTVPAFKEWTGISRKYAIPLLEYLDRERVTRREGDVRLVL